MHSPYVILGIAIKWKGKTTMKENKFLKKVVSESLDWLKTLLIAFVVAAFLQNTVIASARIPTGSMETTVMTGSRIIINRLAYLNHDPKRGDIVTFYYPDDGKTMYLKRIMGLPGETIEGIDGIIYIDGTALKEDYTTEKFLTDFGPFTVPEDSYFMLGDNRNHSLDSRYWENTYVERDKIIGKAEFIFYPEFKALWNEAEK